MLIANSQNTFYACNERRVRFGLQACSSVQTLYSVLVLCGGEQSPHLIHDFTPRPTEDVTIDNDSLIFSV